MDNTELYGKIEMMRHRLVETALAKGSFLDEEVIRLSKELDVLLNKLQHQQRAPRGWTGQSSGNMYTA